MLQTTGHDLTGRARTGVAAGNARRCVARPYHRAMRAAPLLRFLVVGGGATLVELGAFQALLLLGLPPVPANVVSFVIGMLTSFIGYRLWSFAGDHTLPVAGQFTAYATLALINATVSSTLIHVLVDGGVPPLVAKAGCMVAIATWNFMILNRIVFRRSSSAPVAAPSGPAASD